MTEYDNRKDAWEWNAQEALQKFQKMSEDELLDLVKTWNRDTFFVLWIALKEKGTPEKSWPVLIRALRQLDDKSLYLHRYHCCETLFHILGLSDDTMFWDIVGNMHRADRKKKSAALKKIIKEYDISEIQ